LLKVSIFICFFGFNLKGKSFIPKEVASVFLKAKVSLSENKYGMEAEEGEKFRFPKQKVERRILQL